MTLYDGKIGEEYRILGIYLQEGILRRLEALGMNEGTLIRVLNRKRRGAMIIKVRGTRLALGSDITRQIEVRSTDKINQETRNGENA